MSLAEIAAHEDECRQLLVEANQGRRQQGPTQDVAAAPAGAFALTSHPTYLQAPEITQ
jgi:hypothetical protein